MSDFLDWPISRQEIIIREVCRILDKNCIPYRHNRMNRPARSLTLMASGCDAQALMAVYVAQDKIIDELTDAECRKGFTVTEKAIKLCGRGDLINKYKSITESKAITLKSLKD